MILNRRRSNDYNKMFFLFLTILLSGCSVFSTSDRVVPELKVMTHDSFEVSKSIIEQYESENEVKVVFIKSGDAGAMLNRAILTGAVPEADVLYGVDNTYLSRAIEAGIFEPYQSTAGNKGPCRRQNKHSLRF